MSFSKKLFWYDCHNRTREANCHSFAFGLNKKGDDYYITGHMAYGDN